MSKILLPIFCARNRAEFERGLQNGEFDRLRQAADSAIDNANADAFTFDGYCIPCEKSVPMIVDMRSGGRLVDDRWMPNWRERLVCPSCRMNNRQRLIASLVQQELAGRLGACLYFMEQVTPIYKWAIERLVDQTIIGSEYLGYEYVGGSVVNGVRHEDVLNLSFEDEALDLIVSNDVFEHVPKPDIAFQECARVLKSGGLMLASIPFHSSHDQTVIRAELLSEGVNHLLPKIFHGNPVSAEGSLVFTDFGWDLLGKFTEAGFSDAVVEVYGSVCYAHLGGGQLVFRLSKGQAH